MLALHCMTAGLDDLHDAVHLCLACLLRGGLCHNADEGLRAGFPDKDASGIAECSLCGCHRLLDLFIGAGSDLILHVHIDQHLRIDGHGCG